MALPSFPPLTGMRSGRIALFVMVAVSLAAAAEWLHSEALLRSPLELARSIAFDGALILAGVFAGTMDRRWLRAAVGALVVAMAAAAVDQLPEEPLPAVSPTRENVFVREQRTVQQVLTRVLSVQESGRADLPPGVETSEVLPTLHSEEVRVSFAVPPHGVLDTAFGVDPSIEEVFEGELVFEIGLESPVGEAATVFRREIGLEEARRLGFVWMPVTVDLSVHAERSVTLSFRKSSRPSSAGLAPAVYDLRPTDLAFWRKPVVRPPSLDLPNVVVISIDTLRADHLHYLGYPRETSPHLDALAQESVVFRTVVSQAPWTTPSHFSIFTSTYPSEHGADQPIHDPKRSWNPDVPTMASMLRDRGYLTAAFTGKGSISAAFGFYRGFDFYNESPRTEVDGSDVEAVMDKTLAWLADHPDRSFFLFVHTYEPHAPYADRFFVEKDDVPPEDVLGSRIALYDGDIRRADEHVGRLFAELRRLGLMEKTLIVVTSDHGEDLGEYSRLGAAKHAGHGHTLFDDQLLVPLLLRFPNATPKGRVIGNQVRSIDILPTVWESLGFPASPTFRGQSLQPLIDGSEGATRLAYSGATTYGTERESVRSGDFKYIHRLSYGQLPNSFALPLTPPHELYDLKADPLEARNLAGEKPEVVAQHQRMLESIVPGRIFSREATGTELPGTDISKDSDLVENLRSLGYIQ